jgi:hypothetical protein
MNARLDPDMVTAAERSYARRAEPSEPSEAFVQSEITRWLDKVDAADIQDELSDKDVKAALKLAFQRGEHAVGRVMVAVRDTLAARYALTEIYGAGGAELPDVGLAALAAVYAGCEVPAKGVQS